MHVYLGVRNTHNVYVIAYDTNDNTGEIETATVVDGYNEHGVTEEVVNVRRGYCTCGHIRNCIHWRAFERFCAAQKETAA